jgi:superfamily II DNA helicase RecQ
MACTGTATAKVIQDIRDTLRMGINAPCIMGTFNRPNITYEVRFKDSLNAVKPQGAILNLVTFVKKQHDAASLNGEPCSGIIYVHKREDCQGVASRIAKATGISCLAYHAGLKDSEREETQRKWTDGICSIAVATVAFGMGCVF